MAPGNFKVTVDRDAVLRSFRKGYVRWQEENTCRAVCIVGTFQFSALKFILDDETCVYTEPMLPRLTERQSFEYQGVLVICKEGRGTEVDGFTFV